MRGANEQRAASGRRGRVLRALRRALAVLLLWPLVHTLVIVGDGLRDEGREADVAVIFGNRVDEDGAPSPWLRERLDRGLSLYRAGRVKSLIVSGGLGREGHEEAEVMRRYLESRGVPSARVIEDRDGYDTYRTARNVREIMTARGYRSAFVVSQYYHISRSKLALRRWGVDEVYGARARLSIGPRDPWSLAREFLGYYVYLARPYGDVA